MCDSWKYYVCRKSKIMFIVIYKVDESDTRYKNVESIRIRNPLYI